MPKKVSWIDRLPLCCESNKLRGTLLDLCTFTRLKASLLALLRACDFAVCNACGQPTWRRLPGFLHFMPFGYNYACNDLSVHLPLSLCFGPASPWFSLLLAFGPHLDFDPFLVVFCSLMLFWSFTEAYGPMYDELMLGHTTLALAESAASWSHRLVLL